jgi:hypothetical protein
VIAAGLTRVRVISAEGKGRAGELVTTERYRVAGGRSGAGRYRPLAMSFGACPVRADAAAGAAVPPASAEPRVRRGPGRSQRRPSSGTPGRPARSRPLPVSIRRRRELVSELWALALDSFSKLERTGRDLRPLRRLQRLRRGHHCR